MNYQQYAKDDSLRDNREDKTTWQPRKTFPGGFFTPNMSTYGTQGAGFQSFANNMNVLNAPSTSGQNVNHNYNHSYNYNNQLLMSSSSQYNHEQSNDGAHSSASHSQSNYYNQSGNHTYLNSSVNQQYNQSKNQPYYNENAYGNQSYYAKKSPDNHLYYNEKSCGNQPYYNEKTSDDQSYYNEKSSQNRFYSDTGDDSYYDTPGNQEFVPEFSPHNKYCYQKSSDSINQSSVNETYRGGYDAPAASDVKNGKTLSPPGKNQKPHKFGSSKSYQQKAAAKPGKAPIPHPLGNQKIVINGIKQRVQTAADGSLLKPTGLSRSQMKKFHKRVKNAKRREKKFLKKKKLVHNIKPIDPNNLKAHPNSLKKETFIPPKTFENLSDLGAPPEQYRLFKCDACSQSCSDSPSKSRLIAGSENKDKTVKSENENDNDIVEFEHQTKLDVFRSMASFYSKMNKDSVDPYQALQQCAANSKQKIKCVSKPCINSSGEKELQCDVYANEVCLGTVFLIAKTSSDNAKKQLALCVLEKISLPHLSLELNTETKTLNLKGSKMPFDSSKLQDKQKRKASERSMDEEEDRKEASFPGKTTPFNSYLAWVYETHPMLKKVRQLGHLYTSLPFASVSNANKAAILQCLSSLSKIKLELKHSQIKEHHYWSMIMEDIVELFSLEGTEVDDLIISESVLKKVSAQYINLKDNKLIVGASKRSNVDFQDAWHSDTQYKYIPDREIPTKLDDFVLLMTNHPDVNEFSAFDILQKSATFNRKKLAFDFGSPTGVKGQGIVCVARFDGTVIGGNPAIKPKVAKRLTSLESINNLRKCHWTIRMVRPDKANKAVFPADLDAYVKCENWAVNLGKGKKFNLQHRRINIANNIPKPGSENVPKWAQTMNNEQSLAKEGESDKNENNTNQSNDERKSGKPDKEVLLLKYPLESYFKAYINSYFHRPFWVPAVSQNERGLVYKLATRFKLEVSRRGIRGNSRVLVSKTFDPIELFLQSLLLGGRSDKFCLVPPEILNTTGITEDFLNVVRPMLERRVRRAQIEADKQIAKHYTDVQLKAANCQKLKAAKKRPREDLLASTMSHGVQCDLLKGPPLKKLKRNSGDHIEVVKDLERGYGGGSVSLSEYEENPGDEYSEIARVFEQHSDLHDEDDYMEEEDDGNDSDGMGFGRLYDDEYVDQDNYSNSSFEEDYDDEMEVSFKKRKVN